uniref:GH3 auxin-responsive promoter n=1 Tax=Aegilops tauschii subsp. strangulata TaxID=200361 RepID=A0A453EFS5_AEGTS
MLEKKAGEFSGEKVIAEFERLTRDADNVQRETLRRILAENGDTEYLRGLGLAGRTDAASFKECVPLATHADLEPYIERIVDGDATPVLTGKPVTSISLSSGTTQGKRKYLLFNEELVKSTMQIYRTSYAFRNRVVPVQAGRRGAGGRVPQRDAQAQVRVPPEPGAVHQHRQEQRAGPAAGRGRRRRQVPRRREAGGGGLHQPRGHVVGPGPLRGLRRAQRRRGRRQRRRAAGVLRRAGPRLRGPRLRRVAAVPRHRPAGAAGAAAGDVPPGAPPLPLPGRPREPVQVAALRRPLQRRRPPDPRRLHRQGLLQRRLRLTHACKPGSRDVSRHVCL